MPKPRNIRRLKKVKLSLDGLALTMSGKGLQQCQSLEITNGYPEGELSSWLFSQIGLFHLISPHLPRVIETDFSVSPATRTLIENMYAFDDIAKPKIVAPGCENPRFDVDRLCPSGSPERVAVLYSGGKDSMYHMALAQEQYGPENVIAVHIAGLNKGISSGEKRSAISQAAKFGFQNFRIIGLSNGSESCGAEVLRSALIFDPALVVPVALEFGATQIIREAPGSARYFTNNSETIRWFNKRFLGSSGLPIRISWFKRPAGGVVKELILRRPDWIKEVHNCFTPTNYKIAIRRSWDKLTPTFPLFESQCGSCVKCRITRLGWLLYGEHEISKEDGVKFIKHTIAWAKTKWATHKDIMRGSFANYLDEACCRYGVENTFKPVA
ncbi:MAG: hypothetical protein A3G45_00310 [Candidatus Staskawiczbacteria bacterium RIFCSPLOWO2_12_FULL_37_15]|uniref:Uncharacterized protein n=1 Tax=Candidatus Staskawiczbacteria bacterium RIFCSPLOWO2_12_FULL_37_15 TaxID=1802218 RepID=A0A1G2IQ01_9BACT|nr:MAG: hypothetical protein A3G45_00310 [Candidatus Staskawiczbacteria bacterium RIFCSPLOWO2_12_FULL_37_15]OHA25914.1 MAG: hypothetical protein A3D52_02965 [Candidatus Taylorbacteria bacterium RIFCSPHIGHO2_02_FULL_44_36]HXK41023.1 hypothetical protein [Candidatus Paceibacterota bacterium]